MDRFIAVQFKGHFCVWVGLKSNMDRFIGVIVLLDCLSQYSLKSNMDRFIGVGLTEPPPVARFKIQYG